MAVRRHLPEPGRHLLVQIFVFFHSNFLWFLGNPEFFAGIALPLGISFFTFQQISYLLDVRHGRVRPPGPGAYALYVTFFPQLIAGPIVLYDDVASQLQSRRRLGRADAIKFLHGLTLFAIGLSKKVVIADSLSPFVNAWFDLGATEGARLAIHDAWIGAVAYTLQLYFDFSGYSDMAVGLARMVGIRIPQNFNSPYKATSIIDFWRRWHITLTTFFRAYIYIPLGGNRRGRRRQAINVGVVFLLTGLWHGAGWTYVVWGMAHGALVLGNHLWTSSSRRLLGSRFRAIHGSWWYRPLGWGATMLSVTLLWVVFRADNLTAAWRMISAMLGGQSMRFPYAFVRVGYMTNLDYSLMAAALLALLCASVTFPNSLQITCRLWRTGHGGAHAPARRLWANTVAALVVGCLLYLAMATLGEVQSEFLYFQF